MRRTEKEFDFPGYHFSPGGFSGAERTMEKFPAGAVRLYEQEQEEPFAPPCLRFTLNVLFLLLQSRHFEMPHKGPHAPDFRSLLEGLPRVSSSTCQ